MVTNPWLFITIVKFNCPCKGLLTHQWVEKSEVQHKCTVRLPNNAREVHYCVQRLHPARIWCQNDVVSTLMRRHHVESTLIRRHLYAMCSLDSGSKPKLFERRR